MEGVIAKNERQFKKMNLSKIWDKSIMFIFLRSPTIFLDRSELKTLELWI